MKHYAIPVAAALLLALALGACAAAPLPLPPESTAAPSQEKPAPAPTPGGEKADASASARLWEDSLAEVVRDFGAESCGAMLSGEENALYAPVNLYLAMGALNEGAMGETGAQLTQMLGAASPGEALPMDEVDAMLAGLRAYAGRSAGNRDLWNRQEDAPPKRALELTNRLWLGAGYPVRDSFVEAAQRWDAAAVPGCDFGDEAWQAQYESWLQQATGGLVPPGEPPAPGSPMLVSSAFHIRDHWVLPFDGSLTADGAFHTPQGEVTAPFMVQPLNSHGYYRGDGYQQTGLLLIGGAEMHLVLPEEGVSPGDLLKDPAVMRGIFTHQYRQYSNLNLQVPRFAVGGSVNEGAGLQALGVSDAFDPHKADFRGILPRKEQGAVYVDNCQLNACIRMEEQGLAAAALTEAEMAAGTEAKDAVVMRLDRPFLFFIRYNGLPLLVGTVADPVGA